MDQTNYTNVISFEQVSDSIECTRCRKYVKLYVILSVVLAIELALLLYILSIRDDLYHTVEISWILGAVFGATLILMLSQIVYNVMRTRAIERGVGILPIYKVVFDNVVGSVWTGARFVVEIPDGSGVTLKTRPLFASTKPAGIPRARTFIPSLYADDFLGKEVFVMYNPNANKIYVLGLAENFNLPQP